MKPRWRIPWLVAVTFAVSLTVTITANLFALQRETTLFKTTATQTTLSTTVIVALAIDREAKQGDWAQVQAQLRRLNGQPIIAYYQVIGLDGRVLADSRRIEPGGQVDRALVAQALTGALLVSRPADPPHLVRGAIQLPNQQGQTAAILLNVTNWESQFVAMRYEAFWAMMGALLASIAVTALTLPLFWWLVVGPLERLRQVAGAVSAGAVEARAPHFSVMELQQVGAALNQMLARNAFQQYELERINQWLQTSNTALQTQTETMQTINHIGRLLLAETDLQKLTQTVINATTTLTGAEVGAFFYEAINEQGESRQFYTTAGTRPMTTPTAVMSSTTALLAHTFQGQGVVRLDDVRTDPRYGQQAPNYGLPDGHVPVVSYLAAPIISRFGQTIGGLFFGHSQTGAFTMHTEQIVVGLVAQIAVAMDNARLFAAAQREISERRQAERRLNASLTEKGALLKEIHHRVKNNLQVISSLLNLQSRQLTDHALLEIFRESQNRIRSMAIIHEKLYQASDVAQIDFAEYTHSLVSYLFRTYAINAANIRLQIAIVDIALGLDTAIPCGLIINELVSNALKYAFAPQQAGEICVGLVRKQPHHLCLTVSDNGRGLPPTVDYRNTDSFGLQLVNLLTEQLDGTVELDRNGGAAFKITFALPQR